MLEEAGNPAHPLLERVRFLSISDSNLDEFYMVRVAGLKELADSKIPLTSDDGLSAEQQLAAVAEVSDRLVHRQQRCWAELQQLLAKEGISILGHDALTPADRAWLRQRFIERLLPVLTPIAIDPAHPFPFVPNRGLVMVVELLRDDNSQINALVMIPEQIERFIRLPGEAIRFTSIEAVIVAVGLAELFPGMTPAGFGTFRVLRDSDIEIEEEAHDLVLMFKSALKRRRQGRIIRLMFAGGTPQRLCDFVSREAGARPADVAVVEGMVGLADTRQLITPERPDLLFPPYTPRFPERIRDFGGDCFAAIRAKDIVVHHPYESFDVVVQFVRQAAQDPNVIAIKQTLYRTSEDSPIVAALVEAAESGKSVTALVELKARFDEERNIHWARRLETAGAQVVYGFVDLKTHAKISLVARREGDSLRSYVHFGTGNYHPITAKIYTDLSFFTCDQALCRDAARVFNFITGYARPAQLEKLAISPAGIRAKLLRDDRGRDRPRRCRPAGGDLGKDERACRPRDDRRALPRFRRRGVDYVGDTRHLLPAPRRSRPLRQHHGQEHCRAISRTFAYRVLWQRSRTALGGGCGVYLVGGLDAAQSRQPGRDPGSDREPDRASADPRPDHGRKPARRRAKLAAAAGRHVCPRDPG